MEYADKELLRKKVRSKIGLYKLAKQIEIFLPSYHSKYITKEYLINLLKSNIFYLKFNEIVHAML